MVDCYPGLAQRIFWCPASPSAPVFQSFRADETTVRALTRTQVALHELATKHRLAMEEAQMERDAWERARLEMEEKLRQLQVINAEAERLFKDKMADMSNALQHTEDRLSQLDQDHRQLKDMSAAKVQELQGNVEKLQATCDDLERQRQALLRQLQDAAINAQLRKEAEQKVAELESSIAAVKDRARQMINNLQKQRDDAEYERQKLQERLQSTQEVLQHEASLRLHHETEALKLAIERQRLATALEVERVINEPLRHSNHASTTLSHVMRSQVSREVGRHSELPLMPTHASPPYPPEVPISPDVVTVARPGGSPGQFLKVKRPIMDKSLAGRQVTRLGRSWATTSTTAGLLHPLYADNIARSPHTIQHSAHRPYSSPGQGMASSPAAAKRPTSSIPQQRPGSAGSNSNASSGSTLHYAVAWPMTAIAACAGAKM